MRKYERSGRLNNGKMRKKEGYYLALYYTA